MRELILDALKGHDEGYIEVRLERASTNYVTYKMGKVDKVAATTDVGGAIRALLPGHGWGIVSFNTIEELPQRINDAIAASRTIMPDEPVELYPVEPVEADVKVTFEEDFRKHSLDEKVELVSHYDEVLRSASSRIIDTSTTYGDSFKTLWIATSEGTFIEKERADILLITNAVAREGDNVQMAHESFTSRNDYNFILNRENEILDNGKLADQLLDADSVEGGKYTVVLNPNLAGVFIHEAFGHLSESDFIVENPSAQKMMTIGRRFGKEILNVGDNGSVTPDIRGTIYYDDEGVPAGDTALIEEGVLVGRLHNRETAKKMGEKPTGNARAQDHTKHPIIRMTNTYIKGGETSFNDMISDIKLGVYAIDAYGGQTMMENFSFSAGHAFMIRDGKIAEMVRDVVLQGNLFETLANIDAVGNDFTWGKSGGTCGKAGQGAPVAMGAPHIRIQNVIIGGK